jgi:uncharacterized membrane protein
MMTMKHKLEYFYYRVYRLQVSLGNGMVAKGFAVFMLSFLIGLNFYSALFIAYALFGTTLLLEGGGIAGGLVFFSLIVGGYLLFIKETRYKSIINKYKSESKESVKRGNRMILLYMLSSVLFLMLGFYLMIQRNEGSLF